MHRTFQSRSLHFFNELKAEKYPNAVTLAKATGCSRNTAMRCIERLRDEFGVPIEYDAGEKGYLLKDKSFELSTLAPGKDEYIALLLLRELSSMIDSKDLQGSIDSLWQQFASRSSVLSRELAPLLNVFSSDLTQVSILADAQVLNLVDVAQKGESVEVMYQSPWRHQEPNKYLGRIMKVHYSDGSLYVFLHEQSGRGLVLNGSFIKGLKVLDHTVPLKPLPTENPLGESAWLEGFGIWASESLEEVQIEISPPASEYYRKQKWHEEQEDTILEDGTLLRSFPSMLSPELVRRILSIGRYVKAVRPEKLAKLVLEQVDGIRGNLG